MILQECVLSIESLRRTIIMEKFIIKQEDCYEHENNIPVVFNKSRFGDKSVPWVMEKNYARLILAGYSGIEYSPEAYEYERSQLSICLDHIDTFIKFLDDLIWVYTLDIDSISTAHKTKKWSGTNYYRNFPFKREFDEDYQRIIIDGKYGFGYSCTRRDFELDATYYMNKNEYVSRLKETIKKICSPEEIRKTIYMNDDELIVYADEKFYEWGTLYKFRYVVSSKRYKKIYESIKPSLVGNNKKHRWMETICAMYMWGTMLSASKLKGYSEEGKDLKRYMKIIDSDLCIFLGNKDTYYSSQNTHVSRINNMVLYIIHSNAEYLNTADMNDNILEGEEDLDSSYVKGELMHSGYIKYHKMKDEIKKAIRLLDRCIAVQQWDIISIIDKILSEKFKNSLTKYNLLKNYNAVYYRSEKKDEYESVSDYVQIMKDPRVVLCDILDYKKPVTGRYSFIMHTDLIKDVLNKIKSCIQSTGHISLSDLSMYDIYLLEYCITDGVLSKIVKDNS